MNTDKDVLLDIDNLHVSFDLPEGRVQAVHGVSYRVRRGGVLGVGGESSSGKSVTTQAVLGIVPRPGRISSGEIRFYRDKGGVPVDITRLEPDKKEMNAIRGGDISLVFQEPMGAFSPMHTVGGQMVEMLRIHRRVSRAEARERSVDMLGRVGISNPQKRVDQYSFELSGGMRQRAMIAMALLAGPSRMIADEPTTSLDVTIQAQILRLLKELQEERGMSILFITHNLGVVAQIADEIAVMYLGKVVEFASAEELFHNPCHPYTVNLLKSITRIGSGKRRLSAIEGRIPSPFERPSGCPFHTRCPEMMPGLCDRFEPENVEIAPGHSGGEVDERVRGGAAKCRLNVEHLRRFPHAFSAGQRQRIGITRGLVLNPRFVVCDEPISSLDVSVQAEIINLLQDLQEEFGLTYLFIAHDLSVVEHICDRIAVMYLGKIVEISDSKTLFRRPRHPYTEALMSAIPQADPREKMRPVFLEGEIPNPMDPPSGCTFHPRCRYARDICRREVPVLESGGGAPGGGHGAACHFSGELGLEGIV